MHTKFIFVTGGVCSSLGKGISASSIGAIFEAMKFNVVMTKIDPYINIDAGTMSPFQHGEVYVTDDGSETDLDLGNYERFLNISVSSKNSITTGQIYDEVIKRERHGKYLGKCVQVIPHITDEIKRRIKKNVDKDTDILIIEIGGTVGDIESTPFLEAARQFSADVGRENVLYVHLTLIPSISGAGELKTKPTQHSVQKLREIGIQPDLLICRMDEKMDQSMKKKLALFTNVPENGIIEAVNIKHSIYEIPLEFKNQNLPEFIINRFNLENRNCDLSIWENLINSIISATKKVKIAVVGKYVDLPDAYKSIYESLYHASYNNNLKLELTKINSESVSEENVALKLKGFDGILVPGGFGDRGIEGMIATAKYARENNIPYFGICLGMQIMVIEYARSKLCLTDANSTEFDPHSSAPVISLLEEQEGINEKGGTMRLGENVSIIIKDTHLYQAYSKDQISERHRHRYEFNNRYKEALQNAGLIISATTEDGSLVESVEWSGHKLGFGVQYHPEFKSKPFKPHPLFNLFIKKSSIKEA